MRKDWLIIWRWWLASLNAHRFPENTENATREPTCWFFTNQLALGASEIPLLQQFSWSECRAMPRMSIYCNMILEFRAFFSKFTKSRNVPLYVWWECVLHWSDYLGYQPRVANLNRLANIGCFIGTGRVRLTTILY
jgi:hypothetical protein